MLNFQYVLIVYNVHKYIEINEVSVHNFILCTRLRLHICLRREVTSTKETDHTLVKPIISLMSPFRRFDQHQHQMSDVGCRMSDVGCRMSDVRYGVLYVIFYILEVRYQMSDAGCLMLDIIYIQYIGR